MDATIDEAVIILETLSIYPHSVTKFASFNNTEKS